MSSFDPAGTSKSSKIFEDRNFKKIFQQKSCHAIETINVAHLDNAKISNSTAKMIKTVTSVIARPVTKASTVKTVSLTTPVLDWNREFICCLIHMKY